MRRKDIVKTYGTFLRFGVGLAAALLSAVAWADSTPARQSLVLGAPFASGAVLQRQMPIPVWGTAEAGHRVIVTLGEQKAHADVGADGRWLVRLQPEEACCEGRTLAVAEVETGFLFDRECARIELKDVLVGEVWFVSGQSNCEVPLCGDNPHFSDRNGTAVAQKTRLPLVRFCYQSSYKTSSEPKVSASLPVVWKTFEPENLMTPPSFSAVGCYFALELYNALRIPVGLVGAYWGGTRIEPWVPSAGVSTHPELPWQNASEMFNEMVNPWCPYALRGFVWYQGCSNVGEADTYAARMHALYDGWARAFENPRLKLYFVQIAQWGGQGVACALQVAQAKFAQEEPNAAMAVISDLGNLTDIHPNEKGGVGLRLALHALKRDYGFADIEDESPVVKDWTVEGNAVVVRFEHAKRLYLYNRDFAVTTPFELAGADGVFKPAKIENLLPTDWEWNGQKGRDYRGQIEGDFLRLRAEGVSAPKKLRYLFSHPWLSTVYNEANLPLGTFAVDL